MIHGHDPAHQTQRQLLALPAAEYGFKPGMDHTGLDPAGSALSFELVNLVVLACIGTVGFEYSLLDEGHGLGIKLQPGKGPTQGKQKSLFR